MEENQNQNILESDEDSELELTDVDNSETEEIMARVLGNESDTELDL